MALGSVSISTFIPGELEDLTGTVSIIPFTRAEIERLANKKAYPNGKLVWSWSVRAASDTVNVPTDVDYLAFAFATGDYKLLRGHSIEVSVNTITYTIKFTTGGVFTISCSHNVPGYISISGYHYY